MGGRRGSIAKAFAMPLRLKKTNRAASQEQLSQEQVTKAKSRTAVPLEPDNVTTGKIEPKYDLFRLLYAHVQQV